MCAYVHTQKTYQNRHKRDNLYPVGHLSLLSPDYSWNLRDFKPPEQSAINAFLICLQNPPPMRRHPFVGFRAAKVLHFYDICKILYKKTPFVSENTNGVFIRILTKRTFSVWAVSGSSLGVLRVVSRWNRATDSKTKRERILRNSTFWGKQWMVCYRVHKSKNPITHLCKHMCHRAFLSVPRAGLEPAQPSLAKGF